MASIHHRPGTPYWHAAFRAADGRLVLCSTKLTDRAKAMQVALELERVAKQSDSLVEGQLRKIVNSLMERVGGDTIRAPSATDFLREWLASKEASKADNTMSRYTKVVDEFLASLGARAKRPLSAITPRDVQALLTKRLKSGCSPTTVHNDGKILRTAFGRAVKLGLLPNNPADAVELPAIDCVERGTFTSAEVQILVNTAEGEWKSLILLAYFTGARLTDCCRMEWAGVDFARGILAFHVKKTSKSHTVPLHPELLAHLETLAGTDKAERFILPGIADKGPGGRHGMSEGFKRIMRKAGLDLQEVQGGGKRKISRRTFHALRHSFTSALANAGVAPELRMKLTGHKSEAVHRGYTHHELEPLRSAIGKLPGLGTSGRV